MLCHTPGGPHLRGMHEKGCAAPGGAGGPRCVPPRLLGAARAGHWRPLTQPVWGACGLCPGLCGGYPRTGWGALSVPHGTPAGRAPHCTPTSPRPFAEAGGAGIPERGRSGLGPSRGCGCSEGPWPHRPSPWARLCALSLAPSRLSLPMGASSRVTPCLRGRWPPPPKKTPAPTRGVRSRLHA